MANQVLELPVWYVHIPVLEQELRSPAYQKMGWVVIRFDFIGNEIDF